MPLSNTAAKAVPLLNRELSRLDYNGRVLEKARDRDVPLIDRLRFLTYCSRNLDEFFMVRIAGLKRRQQAGLPMRGGDRTPLRKQIELIAERCAKLVTRHSRRPNLPLEDALQLVHLYAERGSPKFEKAAMRWLER